jgi:hypothetical protein
MQPDAHRGADDAAYDGRYQTTLLLGLPPILGLHDDPFEGDPRERTKRKENPAHAATAARSRL